MPRQQERLCVSLHVSAETWERIADLALRTGQEPAELAGELLERGAVLMHDLVMRREAGL